MQEFLIQKNEAGQRFDKYLKKLLKYAPQNFIYKMLRKKNFVLNGKKAGGSERLKEGDSIKLYLSDETFSTFAAAGNLAEEEEYFPKIDLNRLPFEILYEDDDVLVLNKPAGMLSQRAKKEDASANEYLISYLLSSHALSREELKTFRPSICNRLDRNTSGILIAGKSLKGLQEASEKLRNRRIQKYYRCIVEGRVTSREKMMGYFCKDEAANLAFIQNRPGMGKEKQAEMEYRPILNFPDATLLEVHLITGRSHQIRAQLSLAGHPVLGDLKYGASKQKGVHRQMLHASRIVWEDGREIIAQDPPDMKNWIAEGEKRWQNGKAQAF